MKGYRFGVEWIARSEHDEATEVALIKFLADIHEMSYAKVVIDVGMYRARLVPMKGDDL